MGLGYGDWVATNTKHWIFEGTGMKDGDYIPGLVGWEYHGDAADLPGLEVVAATQLNFSSPWQRKWRQVHIGSVSRPESQLGF